MPNAEKLTVVAEITERFTSSSAAVITEYRGLTVKQVSQLRRALGKDTTYAVVKNTLTKRAAAEAGVPIDDSLLQGPTAIAFVSGDPVEAAKGLRDFARTNPLLIIKGGVLEGKALSAAEVNRIADLESREVLLAKLAGALKALPTRAVGLFQAPLSQMARLAKALEEKKPAEGSSRPEQTDAEGSSRPEQTDAEGSSRPEQVDAEGSSRPEQTDSAGDATPAEAAAAPAPAETTEAPAEPAE